MISKYIYIPQKTVLHLSENLTSAVEFPRNVLYTFRRICNKEGGTHLKNAGSKLPKLAILLSKLLKIITTTSTTKTTEPSKGDILANPPVFVDPTPHLSKFLRPTGAQEKPRVPGSPKPERRVNNRCIRWAPSIVIN